MHGTNVKIILSIITKIDMRTLTHPSYVYPKIINNNIATARNHEVIATLATVSKGS
jgi:hypothetical protein